MLRFGSMVTILTLIVSLAQGAEATDKGKVVLVIGASSGIGAASAKLFAANGLKVVVTARREDKLKALVEEMVAQGGTAAYTKVDVSSGASIEAAFQFAEATFGGVDYVFSNAGYNGNVMVPLVQKPDKEIEDNLNINLLGAILTLKHAVMAFEKRGGGAIVFSGSTASVINAKGAGLFAGGAFLPYSAAKAGVDQAHRMAASFSDQNIRSYLLTLAVYDTEMSQRSAQQMSEVVGETMENSAFAGVNPYFKKSVGDPMYVGEVVLAMFDGSSAWAPGSAVVCDNDGTIDSHLFTQYLSAPGESPNGEPSQAELKPHVRNTKGQPYDGKFASYHEEL